MVEIYVYDLPDVQDLGFALIYGKHDHGYVLLKLGVLVETVQDYLGVGVLLEFDDDPQSFSGTFVSDLGDAFQLFKLYKLCHLLDQGSLVDLEGDLGDDDLLLTSGSFLDGSN